jgi:hypothetical protein
MKNPWVKLWRNVLNDEKVSFIIRRYGHDCLTFWIGLLTKCEDGVLDMDEEIFADLCLLETKRYEEIRGVFIKRGLVELDGNGLMVVLNWDEYQVGESTKRVRRYRDHQRNGNETECNAPETEMERLEGEGELEGEVEEEGEEEGREDAPPAPSCVSNSQELEEPSEVSPRAIVQDWYNALSELSGTRVEPPSKAHGWALSVVPVCRGDPLRIQQLRREYFDHWRELWFATARGSRGTPDTAKAPDFDFRAYCANIAHLAARLAAKAPPPPLKRAPTEPPPTPDERAEAAAAFAEACSRTAFAQDLEAVS